MTNPGARLSGVLAIAASILAGCATVDLQRRVSELRVQVGQVAAQRDRLDGALRALADDRGPVVPGGAGQAEPRESVVPFSDPAADRIVVESIGGEVGAPDLSDAPPAFDHYQRGYVLFHQNDFEQAEEQLRLFLAAAPAHPAAADARYWIGECYFARGKYREAIGAWRPVAESDHPADRPDRALARIGAAFAALGDLEMARGAFRKVIERWPDGDAAPSARESLGRLASP